MNINVCKLDIFFSLFKNVHFDLRHVYIFHWEVHHRFKIAQSQLDNVALICLLHGTLGATKTLKTADRCIVLLGHLTPALHPFPPD